jgi:urocanate hydratase
MSVQCFAGNVARGMTLVVLSNGGGVGIGRSSNGGNGIVLDGSARMDDIVRSALSWDVMGGVARRNWARNDNALATVKEWNDKHHGAGHITLPYLADEELVDKAVEDAFGGAA